MLILITPLHYADTAKLMTANIDGGGKLDSQYDFIWIATG
jgi:hypothetical protein